MKNVFIFLLLLSVGFVTEVNPVRELRSLTACADDGFRPPSASSGNNHRLKSVVFSNGVKGECLSDLTWENISAGMVEINSVWVDSRDSRIIFVGTNRGVFKTEDGGQTWQPMLFGTNKMVNFLYIDQVNKNLIYAGCGSGLFCSRNQGRSWQRIYQGHSELEANCLSLIKIEDKEIYLGTEAGLLRSQDNGNIWHRFPGELGNMPIQAIAADRVNNLVYLAADEGLYRVTPDNRAKKVFLVSAADSKNLDEEVEYQINHICIDSNNPEVVYSAPSTERGRDRVRGCGIYLATTQGIFKSEDSGETWKRFTDFGLLSRRVRFISVSADSTLWAATKTGIFTYSKDRWKELSLRLAMQDIRFLTIDCDGNIYVGGDKGLFKSRDYLRVIGCSEEINQEPTIEQVQQAAIKYARIIDPEQIASHRRLARLRALLPDFNLDYDKNISTYNNSTFSRFTVGPLDWGVSLKWSLGDLIWSEQQRLIDSQTRLLINLRQDILDEVVRLYFERRRMQLELISSPGLNPKQRQDKELRIDELTALLDGLTGGYFAKFDLTE